MGKYLFMPDDDVDLTVAIGQTLQLPHIEEPTSEDVDKHHARYVEAFQMLFNKFKGKYAATGEEAELKIY